MLKKTLTIILISFLISCNSSNINIDDKKVQIIKWNDKESIKMLERSDHNQDFYELVSFFQPQINPLFCGIASSVIILNAIKSKENNIESQKDLEVTKPEIFGGGIIEFKSHSQLTLLNEKTDQIKDRKIITLKNLDDKKENIDPGLTLSDLQAILESYDLKVSKYHINEISNKDVNFFRQKVKDITKDKIKYLLVNFNGKDLGLKTAGHISPLVAYDKKSDSVLMMDVAGHKNSWYWVKISDLFMAMNSKDADKYRGYLIISGK